MKNIIEIDLYRKKWSLKVENHILAGAVARLARDGNTQQEISDVLKISQSKVSRLMQNNPHLKTDFKPIPPDGISKAEFLSQIDNLLDRGDIRNALKQLSGDPNFKMDVVYQKTNKNEEKVGFDPQVGRMLSRLIDRSSMVGCAWDLDIKPYSESVPNFITRSYDKDQLPIEFIPLCGISLHATDTLVKSSTVVAMRYHRLVNKGYEGKPACPALLNLNCIPLVHPRVTDKPIEDSLAPWVPDSADVQKYIAKAFPDYHTIFGDYLENDLAMESSKANSVDMIITGIGSLDTDVVGLLDFIYPGDDIEVALVDGTKIISKSDLQQKHVIGDIAGVLLARPGETYDYNKCVVDSLNSRLATLRPSHLFNCRDKSVSAHAQHQIDLKRLKNPIVPAAGVVVVADGVNKAISLLTAIEAGYVSRIIIDRDLELDLRRRVRNLNGQSIPKSSDLLIELIQDDL